MAADALAPSASRLSVAIPMTLRNGEVLVFFNNEFPQIATFTVEQIKENGNIIFMYPYVNLANK